MKSKTEAALGIRNSQPVDGVHPFVDVLRPSREYSLLLIVTTILCACIIGCSGCQQSDLRKAISPDGTYVLVERELNCSALDPYGTILTIQRQRARLGISWLGYRHKQVFAADVPLRQTEVKWLDNRNVEIVCRGCERYGIATRVEQWGDIRMHFDVGAAQKGVF